MGKFEDWMVNRAETRVPKEGDEELILLRTKLEIRTQFMRLYQTIAAGMFTATLVGILTKLLFGH